MRNTTNVLALLLLAAGCRSSAHQSDPSPVHEMWVSDHLRRDQVHAAALVERVVYPHHFAPHSSRLSPLGKQQLAILSSDLRTAPGELAVRRGGADDALFAARMEEVRNTLLAAGLGETDFTLTDGHAGGSGVSSDRLIQVLAEDASPGETLTQHDVASMQGERQ